MRGTDARGTDITGTCAFKVCEEEVLGGGMSRYSLYIWNNALGTGEGDRALGVFLVDMNHPGGAAPLVSFTVDIKRRKRGNDSMTIGSRVNRLDPQQQQQVEQLIQQLEKQNAHAGGGAGAVPAGAVASANFRSLSSPVHRSLSTAHTRIDVMCRQLTELQVSQVHDCLEDLEDAQQQGDSRL